MIRNIIIIIRKKLTLQLFPDRLFLLQVVLKALSQNFSIYFVLLQVIQHFPICIQYSYQYINYIIYLHNILLYIIIIYFIYISMYIL